MLFFTTEPPGIPKVFLVAGFSLPLNISCHSLLACRISVEKSAPIVLWEVPCMLLAVISLAAFNSFTLIFSGPFSLFSFWGPYNVNINVLHVVPGLFLSLFYSLAVISTTFSSSSLIYSSVSFNLILIHSSVFFISVIIFIISGCSLYFLFVKKKTSNFSLCASIPLPSSSIIFTITTLFQVDCQSSILLLRLYLICLEHIPVLPHSV